jgi:hypothetical protein
VEKVERESVTDKSVAPLKLEKKIVVGFKEMDNAETVYTRVPGIFLYHNVGGPAPARDSNSPMNDNVHKL